MANSNAAANVAASPAVAAMHGKPSLPFDVTDSSDVGAKWGIWKQQWKAYAVLTDLRSRDAAFQAGVFISCIGTEVLQMMPSSLPFKDEADREKGG